jgi:hypothetical protein
MKAALHDAAGAYRFAHTLTEEQPACLVLRTIYGERVFYLTGHCDDKGRPIYREGWLH